MNQSKVISACALMSILALTGCATPQSRTPVVDKASTLNEAQKQREMVVEDFVSANRRLQAVASKVIISGAEPVSYTHLDVYKRQMCISEHLHSSRMIRFTLTV